VRSHGLIFSAPMVRAMLAGTKTETRRLKPRKIEVGDELWVRETWAQCPNDLLAPGDAYSPCPWNSTHSIVYRANSSETHALRPELGKSVWKSPIHLRREASRIHRVVTGVRVERLHDITEAGAIAEGIESYVDDGVTYYGPYGKGTACPIVAYRRLWESLHGPGSWDANPEVQVISWAEGNG